MIISGETVTGTGGGNQTRVVAVQHPKNPTREKARLEALDVL